MKKSIFIFVFAIVGIRVFLPTGSANAQEGGNSNIGAFYYSHTADTFHSSSYSHRYYNNDTFNNTKVSSNNNTYLKEFNKAVRAWKNRDWDKAVELFKGAETYLQDTQFYRPRIEKAEVLKEWDKGADAQDQGNWDEAIEQYNIVRIYFPDDSDLKDNIDHCLFRKKWDEGVEQAKIGNWDSAIVFYKEALQFHPDNKTLKENIISCSYHETDDQSNTYLNNAFANNDDDDWINAAIYYYILWKIFDDNSAEVQEWYSRCLSKIETINDGNLKFNSGLDYAKKKLPVEVFNNE